MWSVHASVTSLHAESHNVPLPPSPSPPLASPPSLPASPSPLFFSRSVSFSLSNACSYLLVFVSDLKLFFEPDNPPGTSQVHTPVRVNAWSSSAFRLSRVTATCIYRCALEFRTASILSMDRPNSSRGMASVQKESSICWFANINSIPSSFVARYVMRFLLSSYLSISCSSAGSVCSCCVHVALDSDSSLSLSSS